MFQAIEDNFACTGSTGLSRTVEDVSEMKGCSENQDNYVSALDVKAGERYALYVNNYDSPNGVKLIFGRSAEFRLSDDIATQLSQLENSDLSKNVLSILSNDIISSDSPAVPANLLQMDGKTYQNPMVGCLTEKKEYEEATGKANF